MATVLATLSSGGLSLERAIDVQGAGGDALGTALVSGVLSFFGSQGERCALVEAPAPIGGGTRAGRVPSSDGKDAAGMISVNGTRVVSYDRELAHGHGPISGIEIGLACDAFFRRRGLPVAEFGDHFRRVIRNDVSRARMSRARQRRHL